MPIVAGVGMGDLRVGMGDLRAVVDFCLMLVISPGPFVLPVIIGLFGVVSYA
jgi:hypothetical protein